MQTLEEKHKYVNTSFTKISAKMYDYKCNIKLKVNKETFRAHKDVLTEASDYFSAMFGHNMKEREQDAIELHGISPKGFTAMMDYFYHGHVSIDTANIDDVLEAARFFHIEWLIHVCCDFLVRHLCIENYDSVIELADKYYLGDLKTEIFEFVSFNLMMLAEKSKFVQLSYDLLYEILSQDHFIDAPETYIYKTVMKWLKHDPKRSDKQVSLLKLIRLPLVDLAELESTPEEIQTHDELKDLFEEAKEYQRCPTKQCLMASPRAEVRGSNEALVLFSAIDDANMIQYKIPGVEGYFSEAIDTSFLQSHFEFASIAVLGNFLFVAGGYDRHTMCSSPAFYCYNARNRNWAQLSSMHLPRVSFVLCAGEKGLYAVAGIEHIVVNNIDRENILHHTEYYDPEDNQWSFIPEMPLGCFSCGATVCDSKLWVCGGISDDVEDTVPVTYLHSYETGCSWKEKAPMLCARQGHSALGLLGKIYVFGGYTASDNMMSFEDSFSTEVYDIEMDQWSLLTDSPRDAGHIHSSITAIGDQFVILGGKYTERNLYVFNTKDNTMEDGEFCGEYVQKVATMKIALPPSMM